MFDIENIKSKATENQEFLLPLAVWQTDSPESDEINYAYEKEIAGYIAAPNTPCDKKTSLKLLKRFWKKSFHEFWTSPVSDYLPAVSEGTMKLCEKIYPHDDAIPYAKALISELSEKELARDFLYGVCHGDVKYTTALPSYFYINNIPEHDFQKKYVGQAPNKDGEFEDRFNENRCEICGYQHALSDEPKMQFWHINMDMASFYFSGRLGRSYLNTCIICLEEYKKFPRPAHSPEDLSHFMKIIEVIENTPENMTSGKLKKVLKQSELLKMTLDQIEELVNILGFLDILHSDDSHGMVFSHTAENDQLYPLSDRTYAAHPVYRWTRKCGIDYKTISFLFEGIYE